MPPAYILVYTKYRFLVSVQLIWNPGKEKTRVYEND